MTVKIVSENGTEIFGSLSEIERRDCLLRGTSGLNEKVALNFCGGIVSIEKGGGGGDSVRLIIIITREECSHHTWITT